MPRQNNVFSRELVLRESAGWVAAALFQGERLHALIEAQGAAVEEIPLPWTAEQWTEFNAIHSFDNEHLREVYEGYFFVCAVRQALRWLDHARIQEPRLADAVTAFEVSVPHAKNLRDMREHEDEYLRGEGREPDAFLFGTFEATASSIVIVGDDYLLGGRLSLLATIAALRKLKPVLADLR